ncbi:unnamed protein product [Mycetohabitans rhizoxinica HKI 454]|uniref:Uncharacterized protein n=1 Tax=Mycetohabitans rhizoxinica (strain DSM 19002 / CIP 109453 / HKI 454) TaxID=882378 RepID=E5ANW0_MYCRK|nr:unnamed protein product [Mycetohabitans rhizoxinica HKI 454]
MRHLWPQALCDMLDEWVPMQQLQSFVSPTHARAAAASENQSDGAGARHHVRITVCIGLAADI